tara:strand:- start:107 stop:1147 length:1041 start_codon:yes stop_codon:yes gene_type:complete
LKISPDIYLNNLRANFENINIIFLYGTNIGLIELLYKKTSKLIGIDDSDPFCVSRIDGEEFKNNPSVLLDNINTINMFSQRRLIYLDLMHVSLTKNIENIILQAVRNNNNNYLLLIKAGVLKQSTFLKFFQNTNNSILVPCYEEKSEAIYSRIYHLFSKHKLNFKNNFIKDLTIKFNSDTLTNKMEIEKLDVFLTNNKDVTEEMILKLISRNEDINLNKVVEYCTNGNISEALMYFENIYENQGTSISLIRMFVNHFKLIEKILLLFETKKNLNIVIENMRPPIFFRKKEFVIFQCKVWNLKLIKIMLDRLIELELKCKLNNITEKTLLSQFILSTSLLARTRINS